MTTKHTTLWTCHYCFESESWPEGARTHIGRCKQAPAVKREAAKLQAERERAHAPQPCPDCKEPMIPGAGHACRLLPDPAAKRELDRLRRELHKLEAED